MGWFRFLLGLQLCKLFLNSIKLPLKSVTFVSDIVTLLLNVVTIFTDVFAGVALFRRGVVVVCVRSNVVLGARVILEVDS